MSITEIEVTTLKTMENFSKTSLTWASVWILESVEWMKTDITLVICVTTKKLNDDAEIIVGLVSVSPVRKLK